MLQGYHLSYNFRSVVHFLIMGYLCLYKERDRWKQSRGIEVIMIKISRNLPFLFDYWIKHSGSLIHSEGNNWNWWSYFSHQLKLHGTIKSVELKVRKSTFQPKLLPVHITWLWENGVHHQILRFFIVEILYLKLIYKLNDMQIYFFVLDIQIMY